MNMYLNMVTGQSFTNHPTFIYEVKQHDLPYTMYYQCKSDYTSSFYRFQANDVTVVLILVMGDELRICITHHF